MALTKVSGSVLKNPLSLSGNVSVGGTLTYEDVTNVDAVGVVTAREGIRVGAGKSIGSDGAAVVYYGDGSNLTGISAGVSLTNGADNRVITATSASAITGEANLTWDGTTLLANKASGVGYIASKGGTSSGDYAIVQVQNGTTVRGRLVGDAAVDALRIDTAGGASTLITFHTGSSYTERLRIESGGGLKFTGQGTSIPVGGILHHTNNNLYVRGGTSGLILGNQDSTNAIHISDSNFIKFETNDGSEKLRITSSGYIKHTGLRSGNSQNKLAILTTPSYNTSEEDVALYIAENESGSNQITFGGGTSTYNAATNIRFLTASAVNTTTGSERLRISSTGQLVVGANPTVGSGNIVHIEAPTSFNSGETIVNIEGNNATAGPRLLLHNNNTGANAHGEILGVDAGGQSTSSIRFYNTDQSNNYGEIAFGTRSQSGVPPEDRMRISKDGQVTIERRNQSNPFPAGDGTFTGIGLDTAGGDLATGRIYIQGYQKNADSDYLTGFNNEGSALVLYDYSNAQYKQKWYKGGGTDLYHGGNLRLGTSSTGIDISGTTDGVLNITTTDGRGSFIRLQQSGNTKVWVGSAEGFGSGDQDDAALMAVDKVYLMAGQGLRMTIFANGNASLTGSLTQNSSDIRLKENIQPITNSLEKVKSLSGFTYNWNKTAQDIGFKGEEHDELQVGLSAQDVEKIQPEVVKPAPIDNNYKTIQYEKLVPLLVEAIKEQQEQIETLKTEISALKSS